MTVLVSDVHGRPLARAVRIHIRHLEHGRSRVVRLASGRPARVAGLDALGEGPVRVEVHAAGYRPASIQARVGHRREPALAVVLPADPARVRPRFPGHTELDPAYRRLLSRSRLTVGGLARSGEALYGALRGRRRAGLLNILAKCRATTLIGRATVLSRMRAIVAVAPDRILARVSPSLAPEIARAVGAGRMTAASAALHPPPAGFRAVASAKTPEPRGGLQVTLFTDGRVLLADVDIDAARGLEHALDVVGHALTGGITDPYDIHQILLAGGLDPGYALAVARR
jgi:hypothetical protein